LVSACESCCGKLPHDNPALLHTVLQLWPLPPILHSRTPAEAHASSVDLAMLLLKPFSPEGNDREVKSTCKYPVDDVYTLLELTEPDSRAICSVELHDDDVQRLMVT
jgi:hypothetical protein